MTSEELLESIDRHFMAGCPSISTSQLRQHQARGVCPACAEAAAEAAITRDGLERAIATNAAILAQRR